MRSQEYFVEFSKLILESSFLLLLLKRPKERGQDQMIQKEISPHENIYRGAKQETFSYYHHEGSHEFYPKEKEEKKVRKKKLRRKEKKREKNQSQRGQRK